VERAVIVFGCIFAAAACTPGAGSRGGAPVGDTAITVGTSSPTGGGDEDDDDPFGDASTSGGLSFDLGNPAGDEGGSDCDAPTGGGATLTGTVYAPNGTTPVSGALVFVDKGTPDPIPDHVFCDACVELVCGQPFTFTEPDGTFTLEAPPGAWNLVVQKGQFRRTTAIELADGSQVADATASTMPRSRDEASGRFVPNIALGWGTWDRMQDLLAKLGLADLSGGQFDPGGQTFFDLYGRDGMTGPAYKGDIHDLLSDPAALDQYHIVFLACHGDEMSQLEIENVRAWVAKGGRFYATDLEAFSFDNAFGEYQNFTNIGGLPFGPWPGRVDDPDLAAWLQTFGHGPEITLRDNPSEIAKLQQVLVDDLMGGQVDVSHHTWVSAATSEFDGFEPVPGQGFSPSAISAQYGCGRILYTTYHNTHEPHPDLLPQELTLLYLVLEVGACQEPAGVPEPEG
jgi:hypothetical protein